MQLTTELATELTPRLTTRLTTRPQAGTAADSSWLEVHTELAEATQVQLQLHGELDLATADDLVGLVAGHLAAGRRFVRLELSGLRFLDCTGLGALVNLHNECRRRHGALVLAGLAGGPRRLMELAGQDVGLYIADAESIEPFGG